MPHCIWLEEAESCSTISFYKAKKLHNDILQRCKELQFDSKEKEDIIEVQQTNYGDLKVPSASLHTLHCCYYCIGEKSKEDTDSALFWLAQAIPKNLGTSSSFLVQYTLSYFLSTCLRVC